MMSSSRVCLSALLSVSVQAKTQSHALTTLLTLSHHSNHTAPPNTVNSPPTHLGCRARRCPSGCRARPPHQGWRPGSNQPWHWPAAGGPVGGFWGGGWVRWRQQGEVGGVQHAMGWRHVCIGGNANFAGINASLLCCQGMSTHTPAVTRYAQLPLLAPGPSPPSLPSPFRLHQQPNLTSVSLSAMLRPAQISSCTLRGASGRPGRSAPQAASTRLPSDSRGTICRPAD